MPLTGKVAIVTGGGQGIGKAYCDALLNIGMKVCLCDINETTSVEYIKNLPSNCKDDVFFQKCDVTSITDFKDAFDKTIEVFGRIDVLINNAGIINEHDWRKVIDVNFIGVVQGIQLAFHYMSTDKGKDGGFIINTASRNGFKGKPISPVYCATKHAVIGITKSYGSDYHFKKTGIKVSAICPGPVDTPLLRDYAKWTLDEKEENEYHKTLIPVKPEEIGKALIKLLEEGKNGCLLKADNFGLQYV